MMWQKLEQWIMGNKATQEDAVTSLLSADAFEDQLTRERARADRSNTTFTVLAVDAPRGLTSEQRAEVVELLAAAIQRRTRVTDIKGWFGDRLGIILPATPAHKIDSVCRSIEEAFRHRVFCRTLDVKSVPQLRYEVFAYPPEASAQATAQMQAEIEQDAETGTKRSASGPKQVLPLRSEGVQDPKAPYAIHNL